jgi:hypothetical protein
MSASATPGRATKLEGAIRKCARLYSFGAPPQTQHEDDAATSKEAKFKKVPGASGYQVWGSTGARRALEEKLTGLFVETFREGMLSALGHDLRLAAERFELRVAEGELTGSVELATLHVLGCIRRGRLDRSAPSPSERVEIEQRMRDILDVAKHPRASMRGTVRSDGSGWLVDGTLELRGRQGPFSARITRSDDLLEGSLELAPSRFGIAPFKALGGALRIADRVVVRARLRTTEAAPGLDLAALTACWQRSGS